MDIYVYIKVRLSCAWGLTKLKLFQSRIFMNTARIFFNNIRFLVFFYIPTCRIYIHTFVQILYLCINIAH